MATLQQQNSEARKGVQPLPMCRHSITLSLDYAHGIAFPWMPKFSYHESMVILMNKKGIRQFSPEMRLRSRDRWRIKGASPSGTSRGPTFSPKFHLNVLNLGRNDMKQAIVRNHEAVQHPNPRFCTPEVEPVSHSNSRATSGGTHRSGSGVTIQVLGIKNKIFVLF